MSMVLLKASSSSSSPKTFDRALGLVISLAGGAGLYLLHAWLQSLRSRKRQQGIGLTGLGPTRSSCSNEGSPCSSKHSAENRCNSINGGDTGRTSDDISPNKNQKKVLHTGSCHCGRFEFRVLAPEELCVVEYGACKLKFPRLILSSLDFEIVTDESSLSLYSVMDGQQVGIHAFCSFCGMQVLYSPPPPSASCTHDEARGEVVVNADCLDKTSVRKLHVAYGGNRDTVPYVIHAPSSSSRPMHSHRDVQQHHLQHSSKHYRYPGAEHMHRQTTQTAGAVVKAGMVGSSLHSGSSVTRALTVSSGGFTEQEALDLDDASHSSTLSDRHPAETRGGNRTSVGSVDLLRHLLHESRNDGARMQTTRPDYCMASPGQQSWSAPREVSGDVESRLFAIRHEEPEATRNLSQTPAAEEQNDPRRTLSSSSLQQLGHSPSLYDTIPLMYSYAAANPSPLEQLPPHPHQQQSHFLPPQHPHPSLDAPVMIRGAELAGPTGLLGIDLRGRSSVGGSGISGRHIAATSLHHRLKLYLQQHLDKEQ